MWSQRAVRSGSGRGRRPWEAMRFDPCGRPPQTSADGLSMVGLQRRGDNLEAFSRHFQYPFGMSLLNNDGVCQAASYRDAVEGESQADHARDSHQARHFPCSYHVFPCLYHMRSNVFFSRFSLTSVPRACDFHWLQAASEASDDRSRARFSRYYIVLMIMILYILIHLKARLFEKHCSYCIIYMLHHCWTYI